MNAFFSWSITFYMHWIWHNIGIACVASSCNASQRPRIYKQTKKWYHHLRQSVDATEEMIHRAHMQPVAAPVDQTLIWRKATWRQNTYANILVWKKLVGAHTDTRARAGAQFKKLLLKCVNIAQPNVVAYIYCAVWYAAETVQWWLHWQLLFMRRHYYYYYLNFYLYPRGWVKARMARRRAFRRQHCRPTELQSIIIIQHKTTTVLRPWSFFY